MQTEQGEQETIFLFKLQLIISYIYENDGPCSAKKLDRLRLLRKFDTIMKRKKSKQKLCLPIFAGTKRFKQDLSLYFQV